MQLLTDSVVATLLTGSLVLLLASITLRQNDEAQTISSHRSMSGRTASLAATVRTDLENVAALQARSDSSVTFSVISDPATLAEAAVTYAWERRIEAGDTLVDVYRTEAGATRLVGSSLDGWDLTLLDASDTEAGSLADVVRLSVRAVLPPAFASPMDTLATVWERTVSPPLLGEFQF